jgi:benzodiazapine receptor
VGIASSGLTISNIHRWYLTLTPPPLNPPSWVFAPVWSTLYLLMGISAWLIWRQAELPRRPRRALLAWGWQLGLNAIWAPVFFGLHQIAAALAVVLALFAAVAWTLVKFLPLSRTAGLLLVPYLAWVGFASYLNAGFWWLNHT